MPDDEKHEMRETRDIFVRHLSDDFMKFLAEGAGRWLLDSFQDHQLDVRLRGNYFNAYTVGNSLAKVAWNGHTKRATLTLHAKYLKGFDLPEQRVRYITKKNGEKEPSYIDVPLDETAVSAYVACLDALKENAAPFAKPEARWEERCIRSNLLHGPQVVLDRQIAKGDPQNLPGETKERRGARRLDVLTALAPEDPGVVALELKRDCDARIQEVPLQVMRYLEFLDPEGKGFSPVIAGSYRRACAQYASLGLPAPAPHAVASGLPVYGLIGLANYNQRSALLDRAKQAARTIPRKLYYCFIDDDAPKLPPRSDWRPLE